jgi:hypothetical protein
MKKNIIIYGLVAGLIVTSWMIAGMIKLFGRDFEGGMLLGYSTMLVAFSLIFVSVKSFRDKQNNGVITFGKAFRIGLMITLIASTIYVLVWMIDYYYFIPDFFKWYAAHAIAKMKASGASAAEIQKMTAQVQGYAEVYKNPFFNAMYTYLEILPVGLLVSVVAAFILKRKPGNVNVAIG